MLRFHYGNRSATVICDEPKKPDFDARRGRDDFKKLLAEVGAKSRPNAKPKD